VAQEDVFEQGGAKAIAREIAYVARPDHLCTR